jgi:hypothetical protein
MIFDARRQLPLLREIRASSAGGQMFRTAAAGTWRMPRRDPLRRVALRAARRPRRAHPGDDRERSSTRRGPFAWQALAAEPDRRGTADAAELGPRGGNLSYREAFQGEYHGMRSTIRDHPSIRPSDRGDAYRSTVDLPRSPPTPHQAVDRACAPREIYRRTSSTLAADPVGAGSTPYDQHGGAARFPSLGMILRR